MLIWAVRLCVFFSFLSMQKRACRLRISNCSSDVCSSDLVAMIVLTAVGSWYRRNRHLAKPKPRKAAAGEPRVLTRGRVLFAIVVLVALLFSKNVYSASLSSYYTFYLMSKFGLSVQAAQVALFAFLGALVAGTLAGGWIGDRIGRIPVIWFSILGVLPFTLVLPHVGL